MKFVPSYLLRQLATTITIKKVKKVGKSCQKSCQKVVKKFRLTWEKTKKSESSGE
jgi:hypothetical protein